MYSCFNPNTLLVPLINKCMIGQNVLCFSATATPQTNAKITKLYFWHSDQKVSQTKGAGLMYSAVTQWMCTCSFHTGNYPSSHIKHTLNNTSICKIHLASYKMPIRTRASIQFFLSIWGCCCWVVIQWGQDGPDCGGSERRTDGRLWVYSFKCYGAINVPSWRDVFSHRGRDLCACIWCGATGRHYQVKLQLTSQTWGSANMRLFQNRSFSNSSGNDSNRIIKSQD